MAVKDAEEAVVACFKVLSNYLLERTEGHHENLHQDCLICSWDTTFWGLCSKQLACRLWFSVKTQLPQFNLYSLGKESKP